MTQEEKDLLLKDLCTRLPYGVKVESIFINPDTKEHKSCGMEVFDATSLLMIRDGLGKFKPYLLPLSSMNKKQKEELENLGWSFDNFEINNVCECFGTYREFVSYLDCFELIDWLNKNHFDYRGLISMGLAIDATDKNIY